MTTQLINVAWTTSYSSGVSKASIALGDRVAAYLPRHIEIGADTNKLIADATALVVTEEIQAEEAEFGGSISTFLRKKIAADTENMISEICVCPAHSIDGAHIDDDGILVSE